MQITILNNLILMGNSNLPKENAYYLFLSNCTKLDSSDGRTVDGSYPISSSYSMVNIDKDDYNEFDDNLISLRELYNNIVKNDENNNHTSIINSEVIILPPDDGGGTPTIGLLMI